MTTWGTHFAVDRIFGSKLKVLLAFLQEDVEDDDLALLFPELAKDGELYQLSLSYSRGMPTRISTIPNHFSGGLAWFISSNPLTTLPVNG